MMFCTGIEILRLLVSYIVVFVISLYMSEAGKGTLRPSYKLNPLSPITIQKPAFIHHTIGAFSTYQLWFWHCIYYFSSCLLASKEKNLRMVYPTFSALLMGFKSLVFWHIGLRASRVRLMLLGYRTPVWLSIVYWSLWPPSFTWKIIIDWQWDSVSEVSVTQHWKLWMTGRCWLTVTCRSVLSTPALQEHRLLALSLRSIWSPTLQG